MRGHGDAIRSGRFFGDKSIPEVAPIPEVADCTVGFSSEPEGKDESFDMEGSGSAKRLAASFAAAEDGATKSNSLLRFFGSGAESGRFETEGGWNTGACTVEGSR